MIREVPMTTEACPRCSELARKLKIRAETVMPLPAGAFAGLSKEGIKQCFDCAAAEKVQRFILQIPGKTGFEMARIVVGNERQEAMRLPGVNIGAMCRQRMMHDSKPGDFDKHLKWLDTYDWFGQKDNPDSP